MKSFLKERREMKEEPLFWKKQRFFSALHLCNLNQFILTEPSVRLTIELQGKDMRKKNTITELFFLVALRHRTKCNYFFFVNIPTKCTFKLPLQYICMYFDICLNSFHPENLHKDCGCHSVVDMTIMEKPCART